MQSLKNQLSNQDPNKEDRITKSGPQGNEAPPKAPTDKVQDKIAFIFNNLSLMNMTQKGEELKDILSGSGDGTSLEDFSGWLAQYLVMKRASIEPNFHTLYSFSRSASVFFSTKIWQNSVKFIDRVPFSILLII